MMNPGTFRPLRGRVAITATALAGSLLLPTLARADEPAPAADAASAPVAPLPEKNADAVPEKPVAPAAPTSPERKATLEPKPVEHPTVGRTTFSADPIADGGIILASSAFAGILDLINSTGEIRPQQISPAFDRSALLGIDRSAIVQTVDPNARTLSNIALVAAIGFAVLDPLLSGIREKSVQTGLVDALIYGEALALTWGVTNLAKVAVRRPRPQAYIDAAAHKGDPNYSNSDTDSSLSFFSGHASMTASVAATATYLAFARAPGTARPWVTLGLGAAVTTFVSIERVRAGAHFPTDVLAGSVAGAGIGILVAHLHRTDELNTRRIWVGFGPERSGGTAQLGGVF